jgi:agmatinase
VGFVRGLRARKPDAKVGFLNMDGHFDLWDEFRDMGRFNHGTFARRISEHEAVGTMVWWGLNGTNIMEPEQLRLCRDRGFAAYTVDSIRRRGVRETMTEALEIASEGADAVYVTFDIDVTDGAYAPGTHSIVIDGLTPGEVLQALSVLPDFDSVQAFDVCEMIPQYDVGGGRTARYAAQVILAVIGHRILDSESRFSRADLDRVFR